MKIKMLIVRQVHCQLEGQITKYGYNILKPSTVISNQTSPISSFDRRQTPTNVLKTSVIQFSIDNYEDEDLCENRLSFYIPDSMFSSICPCPYKWMNTD